MVSMLLFLVAAIPALAEYQSFAELTATEQYGRDYQTVVQDRKHRVLVLAIHGGRIETGTSELADAIAGHDFNLYKFEGISDSNNYRMHITSTRFDDPQALELARRSEVCISLHGQKRTQGQEICAGGARPDLRQKMFTELVKLKLIDQKVENPCNGLYGIAPSNVVNVCSQQGLQLEMSDQVRKRIVNDPKYRKRLAEAIRSLVVGSGTTKSGAR